ncbi:MAG: hypothetical protein HY459_02115 [Parcubacteria group bacterium]|nr:hypothetical protein [Parcubacteria group bacterium]
MKKRFFILLGVGVLLLAAVFFLRFGNITSALWQISDGGKFLLPLVVVAALIDSINPCAFSVLLLTIGFLVSLSAERRKILATGGFYILGLLTVYLLIGLGIIGTLHLFNTPHFMAKLGASILIALGAINLINEFYPNFPIKLRIPKAAHAKMGEFMKKGSLPAAFLLGGLVGICEFPCTGGPYLMILGLLHDEASYLPGLGYLLLYNLIFILPLIVILFIASDAVILEKVRLWKKVNTKPMRLMGGIAMVLLGLLIFAL